MAEFEGSSEGDGSHEAWSVSFDDYELDSDGEPHHWALCEREFMLERALNATRRADAEGSEGAGESSSSSSSSDPDPIALRVRMRALKRENIALRAQVAELERRLQLLSVADEQ